MQLPQRAPDEVHDGRLEGPGGGLEEERRERAEQPRGAPHLRRRILEKVQRGALCRSRRELSDAYFVVKFGFDTAQNEPF